MNCLRCSLSSAENREVEVQNELTSRKDAITLITSEWMEGKHDPKHISVIDKLLEHQGEAFALIKEANVAIKSLPPKDFPSNFSNIRKNIRIGLIVVAVVSFIALTILLIVANAGLIGLVAPISLLGVLSCSLAAIPSTLEWPGDIESKYDKAYEEIFCNVDSPGNKLRHKIIQYKAFLTLHLSRATRTYNTQYKDKFTYVSDYKLGSDFLKSLYEYKDSEQDGPKLKPFLTYEEVRIIERAKESTHHIADYDFISKCLVKRNSEV